MIANDKGVSYDVAHGIRIIMIAPSTNAALMMA